jgi:FAD/FMN-containing dehydrogenase
MTGDPCLQYFDCIGLYARPGTSAKMPQQPANQTVQSREDIMSQMELVSRNGATVTLPEETVNEFRSAMRGEVLTSKNVSYDEVRAIWNGKIHDKHPGLIARCSGVADVMTAVNFARENDLLVAVRGGGHNVSGSGSCDGGIMIDLSLMNGVFVDPKAKTARVQGGATWGDVDRETQVYGLATAGGVVSTTGVAGLTLGGGLGYLRRKYGLTIDNLLSVDIVTADSRVLTASESENPDLFWGIRGGGGNFGVVTSFEFRLHPVGPMVTFCAPWYPVDEAKKILPAWRDYMKDAPEEFSCSAVFWTVPPAPDFPQELHFKRFVAFIGVHCGNVEEGARVIQPLRELGMPMLDLSGPMPWTAVQQAFDPLLPKGQRMYYFKSRLLKDLDEPTLNAVVDRAVHPPSPFVLVVLWQYGGAMQRVKNTETAFMGREAACLLSVDGIWDDPADTQNVVAYARNFLADMAPYSAGGLYVNFAGFGEEGEQLVKDAYGTHYQRLAAIKNKYDPTNLFRLNQNIKPSASQGS